MRTKTDSLNHHISYKFHFVSMNRESPRVWGCHVLTRDRRGASVSVITGSLHLAYSGLGEANEDQDLK